MKTINLRQILFLLFSGALIASKVPKESINHFIETPNVDSAKIETPIKDQQRLITTCYAHRAIMGHDGEIAQWKAKCRVEVWAGDSQTPPELKELTSEQREKLMTEYAKKNADLHDEATQDSNSILNQSRFLVNEAEVRHKICVEAKRSILSKLKEFLPAGYNSCEKIKEVMNNLKLSPELEHFISEINGDMKNILAMIHSIEHQENLSNEEKMNQIRNEKIKLTELLDEKCKDDHPSIGFHNVGLLPPSDIDKFKSSLITDPKDPDSGIEVVHSPPGSLPSSLHENLTSINKVVAQHATTTKQTGEFDTFFQPQKDSNNGGVITVANSLGQDSNGSSFDDGSGHKNDPTVKANTEQRDQIPDDSVVNTEQKAQVTDDAAVNTGQNNIIPDHIGQIPDHIGQIPEQSINYLKIDKDVPMNRNGNIFENFWKGISDAVIKNKKRIAFIEKYPNFSNSHQKPLYIDNAMKRYYYSVDFLIKDLLKDENISTALPLTLDTMSTWNEWRKTYKYLNDTEKEIEDKYLRRKEFLKKADKYVKDNKELLKSLGSSFVDKIYNLAKNKLKSEREEARLRLKSKNSKGGEDKIESSASIDSIPDPINTVKEANNMNQDQQISTTPQATSSSSSEQAKAHFMPFLDVKAAYNIPVIENADKFVQFWEAIMEADSNYKERLTQINQMIKDKTTRNESIANAKARYDFIKNKLFEFLFNNVDISTKINEKNHYISTFKEWHCSFDELNDQQKAIEKKYILSKLLLQRFRDQFTIEKNFKQKINLEDYLPDIIYLEAKTFLQKERSEARNRLKQEQEQQNKDKAITVPSVNDVSQTNPNIQVSSNPPEPKKWSLFGFLKSDK